MALPGSKLAPSSHLYPTDGEPVVVLQVGVAVVAVYTVICTEQVPS